MRKIFKHGALYVKYFKKLLRHLMATGSCLVGLGID